MVPGGADAFLIRDLCPPTSSPRQTSERLAGACPCDLHTRDTGYHPNYPPASRPVYQRVIFSNKRANARKIATVNDDQAFRNP